MISERRMSCVFETKANIGCHSIGIRNVKTFFIYSKILQMKPFSSLTLADKARLLFQLFPERLSPFINILDKVIEQGRSNPGFLKSVQCNLDLSTEQIRDVTQKLSIYRKTHLVKQQLRRPSDVYFLFRPAYRFISLYALKLCLITADESCSQFFKISQLLFTELDIVKSQAKIDEKWDDLWNAIEFPFEAEQIQDVEANFGTVWVDLKDGRTFSIVVMQCEKDDIAAINL